MLKKNRIMINTFDEFSEKLEDSTRKVNAMAAVDNDPAILSITRQLAYVKKWTGDGQRPDQQDLDRLSFGAMASRCIHESDPDLANQLYELSNYLIYWPPSEQFRG